MCAAVLAAGLKVELAMTVEGNRDTKEFAVEDPGEQNVEAPNPGFATPEAFRAFGAAAPPKSLKFRDSPFNCGKNADLLIALHR
jgi:hypothetical protein